jgi:hypothetical protein
MLHLAVTLLSLGIAPAAHADLLYGCGVPGYPDCSCVVTDLTLTRETIFPDGSAEMTIHLEFDDGEPGYTYAFEFEVVQVAGPGAVTVDDITPNPLEIVASTSFPSGSGEGEATVSVSVPADVDATNDPINGTVSVNEMQILVTLVPAQAYPSDDVVMFGMDASEHGSGVSPTLRTLNGDLCVVPNGETPIAHGTLYGTTHSTAYFGRFGGQFLDASGDS